MKRLAALAAFVLLCAMPIGCGDGKGSVNGTVALDGKAVKSGAIALVSTEEPGVREGAVITDGAFTAKVPPGKYKIELNAQHVTGKRKQIGMDGKEEELTLTEELFPEQFNTKSDLTEVIKPGANTLTFNLKSKK